MFFYLFVFDDSDASRRDLTINAMFLDMEGNVIDYFDGAEDLSKKLIRFVGDPNERIREDYLRIFRYFRFYVRYGCHTKHDSGTLDAIRSNCQGLQGISGERIWTEMKKILSCKRCDSVMPLIINDLGISPFMGFQRSPIDLKEFSRSHAAVFSEEPKPLFEPVTLMSSLILVDEDMKVGQRLKFSNFEKDVCAFIIANRDDTSHVTLTTIQKKLALAPKSQQRNMRLYILEFLRYIRSFDTLKQIESWEIPEFPMRGDALKHKVAKPKNMTPVMEHLKKIWAENGFNFDADLLDKEADLYIQKNFAK